MPLFHCSAILFDLDGVLCDSTKAVDREWREWAQRKGVDGEAIMAIAHGVRTIEVIRRVAPISMPRPKRPRSRIMRRSISGE